MATDHLMSVQIVRGVQKINNMDNYNTLVHTQDWKDYKSHYIFEVNGHGMIRVTQYNNEFELSDLFIKDGYR